LSKQNKINAISTEITLPWVLGTQLIYRIQNCNVYR